MNSQFNIGDKLEFTNQDGARIKGVVVGRDWSFTTLLAYTVRSAGKCYHVNANTFVSGHSF